MVAVKALTALLATTSAGLAMPNYSIRKSHSVSAGQTSHAHTIAPRPSTWVPQHANPTSSCDESTETGKPESSWTKHQSQTKHVTWTTTAGGSKPTKSKGSGGHGKQPYASQPGWSWPWSSPKPTQTGGGSGPGSSQPAHSGSGSASVTASHPHGSGRPSGGPSSGPSSGPHTSQPHRSPSGGPHTSSQPQSHTGSAHHTRSTSGAHSPSGPAQSGLTGKPHTSTKTNSHGGSAPHSQPTSGQRSPSKSAPHSKPTTLPHSPSGGTGKPHTSSKSHARSGPHSQPTGHTPKTTGNTSKPTGNTSKPTHGTTSTADASSWSKSASQPTGKPTSPASETWATSKPASATHSKPSETWATSKPATQTYSQPGYQPTRSSLESQSTPRETETGKPSGPRPTGSWSSSKSERATWTKTKPNPSPTLPVTSLSSRNIGSTSASATATSSAPSSTISTPPGCENLPQSFTLSEFSWFNSTHNLDCVTQNYPADAQVCWKYTNADNTGSALCDATTDPDCTCTPYCYTGLAPAAYQPLGYGPPDDLKIGFQGSYQCEQKLSTGFRDYETGEGHVGCGGAADVLGFYGNSNVDVGTGTINFHPPEQRCGGSDGISYTPFYTAQIPVYCTRDSGGNATCHTDLPIVVPLTSLEYEP